MSAIAAWWALPVVATLVAMMWVAWVNRARGPGDASQTTRDYAKFRAAMERPAVPQQRAKAFGQPHPARRGSEAADGAVDGAPSP